MSGNSFGFTTTDSTSKTVSVVATKSDTLASIVGHMVYMDTFIDNETYRSIGTVTDVKTVNPSFNVAYEAVAAKGINPPGGSDLRKLNFTIQATFKKGALGVWDKHSSALPTSPSTMSPVNFLTEEIVEAMTANATYPTVGFFRGMGSAPQPLAVPDFGGSTGSSHSAVIGKSGSGKDLALTTIVPTPNGWTTIGELKAGDKVLSEFGKPITVLKVHEILTDSVCYEVLFDDGELIVAGSGHLWYTETVDEIINSWVRKNGSSYSFNRPQVTSSLRKLADEVDANDTVNVEQFIQLLEPIIGDNTQFLVEETFKNTSTVLSEKFNTKVWVNKVAEFGSRTQRTVNTESEFGSVKTTEEIAATYLTSDGENYNHTIPLTEPVQYSFVKLSKSPYDLGVEASTAHTMPSLVLQAAVGQRQWFLLGLMDTNGSVDLDTGTVAYETVDETFAKNIQTLVNSLGYKSYLTKTINGWSTHWLTKKRVFWEHTKYVEHQNLVNSLPFEEPTHRTIVGIKKVSTVPTKCITVNSPTALYLVGTNFVPTHNTAFYTYMLSAFMLHEEHAILVIDPQGQWSNENGMVMSAQKFAKGLGREVNVLRVAEDIKLPMDEEIFTRMLQKVRLWNKFRRMGSENLEAFSDAVASRIAKLRSFDENPRELLSKIFANIAYSQSTLSRIYTKGERRDDFRRDLLMLAGEPLIDPETEEQELLTAEDLQDVENNWESILTVFVPLINLFSNTNMVNGKRKPLGGEYGFLKDVFQIRNSSSKPAPYVVLDMSPSVELNAKASLTNGGNNDVNMQKILDNQDVKALILMMVLDEMKKASEVAFAQGGGNLNTQIVFDEAWRFAPEGKSTPEIEQLASMLEGFALDTRKFGIGWTYILQSPADLKYGIWKQLTYVYVGYGLVGDDIKRLESLTDDPKQLDLYRQFIPPKSTQIYPFMLMGPISPIIFTTAPAFVNVFNSNEDFLLHNNKWVTKLTQKNSMPTLTVDYLKPTIGGKQKFVAQKGETKSFKVGKTETTTRVTPQNMVVSRNEIVEQPINDGLEDMPF